MIIKNNNISKKVTFLLFSIFFLIGAITFKDYGMSIDEEWQRFSGFYWLNYILSLSRHIYGVEIKLFNCKKP